MNSHELYTRRLIDVRAALVAALIADGWPQDEADALLLEHLNDVEPPLRKWKRWTPDEMVLIDAAIDEAGGGIPGRAVTRPLAEHLGRGHKAVVSQIERRIAGRVPS